MADIAQLGIEIDTRKVKSGEKELASFASTADKTSSVVATATKAIATMAAAFATSQIVKAADAYSMMNARVSRFTDSAESATAVMRSLTNYANAAGAEVGSAVAVFTSLSGALQDVGTSQSDILRLTETLNKLGVIGGSSADEVSNALRQFAQSMAGGVVRAEEFNSILEGTPEIARAIAAGMGSSMGQLRQDMLAGKLTSEAVLNSLMSQTETVDAQFAKMPRTVSAAMQTIENEFGGLVGVLNNSTGATSTLAGGIDALSGALVTAKDHTNEIITVAEALAAVYASRLVGSMVASKAAMTAFTATMALFNGASAVATVRTDSLGMSYTTMATRATVGAAAIRGLNGAMAMLGGPAGVVMLAVSAIYMWTSATDEARQKAIEYADGVDTATASLRNMTSAQLAASQVKLAQSIDAQAQSASELRAEVEELQDTVNKQIAVSKMLGNATAANTYEMDQLKLKSAELESAESKLSQMRSKSYAITQTLNGNLKDNYVAMQNSNSVTGIASGIQSVFNGVLNTGNKLLQQRNNYVLLGSGAKSNLTATDQKYLTQLENEIALEKELDPIKRARIKAEQEAAAQGLSASGTTQYINQSVKLAEVQAKNDAASKSLTASYKSESAAAANATKQINSEIIALEFSVATIGKTEAQIALYKLATEGATKAQLEHTKTLLNQLAAYDAQIKKQQDAIAASERYNQMMRQYDELITGAKSGTTEYGQTLHDLNLLLAEGKINQQEYNAAVGRLNTKYAEAGQSAVDWSKIQEDAINAGKDALAEFLYDPLDGGFSGMVDSFTVALRQMAAQAAAANIMQSLFGATGTGQVSGGGGWTGTLASTVGSMFSFDGGGYTGNGSRSGGLDGKGGFWAMMHPQETVIDHTKSGVDNSRTVNTSSESNSNTRNTVINLSQTINTTGKIDNRTSKQIAADTYRKQRLAQRRLGA